MGGTNENTNALGEMLIQTVGCALRRPDEKDYTGEDGLIYCGKCNHRMQTRISLPLEGFENRIVRCMCECEKAEEAEKERVRQVQKDMQKIASLRNASLIDEKFMDSTFENFKKTENNARQLKLCQRYASAFDQMIEKNQGLLFWGNPGTGKTFAAACIANELLNRQVPVVMTSFVKLIADIQRFREGDDEEAIIRKLNRAKLLIIDDLGAERATDFALEKVYNIVDSRYRARKPMILTTNLSLKQMQEVNDIRYARIYDRVFEVCYPLEFIGPSWRYAEAASRYDEMAKLFE